MSDPRGYEPPYPVETGICPTCTYPVMHDPANPKPHLRAPARMPDGGVAHPGACEAGYWDAVDRIARAQKNAAAELEQAGFDVDLADLAYASESEHDRDRWAAELRRNPPRVHLGGAA